VGSAENSRLRKELDERLAAIEDKLGSIEARLSELPELSGVAPVWLNVRQAAEYPGTTRGRSKDPPGEGKSKSTAAPPGGCACGVRNSTPSRRERRGARPAKTCQNRPVAPVSARLQHEESPAFCGAFRVGGTGIEPVTSCL
jgi:hypothetical protein